MDAPENPPPFTHVIRVGWADCDPARIAFTGRVVGFALEAIDAWWEHTIGADWFRMHIDRDYGAPFVHMTIDFRSPITPRHKLACEVRLLKLGDKSVRLGVRAYQDGKLNFEGEFVEAMINASSFTGVAVPESIVEALRAALPASDS